MALLGVALAGGCAVYEIPTLSGAPAGAHGGSNGFGGLHDDGGSAGSPADPDSWGGQSGSLASDIGQAGAIDSGAIDSDDVGGAMNGGTAGGSGGSGGASADAGAAGWHEESQGGNGGTVGASGGGGSAAGSTSCVAGWRNQSACEQCATQVQPDLRACAEILDCYVRKSCGPSSCSATDQKCGPNVLQKGVAAYSIAQDVYACMCK